MPVSSLIDPALEDVRDLLDTGFKHGEMLTLVVDILPAVNGEDSRPQLGY